MQLNGPDDKFVYELEISPDLDTLVRKSLQINPVKSFLNDP